MMHLTLILFAVTVPHSITANLSFRVRILPDQCGVSSKCRMSGDHTCRMILCLIRQGTRLAGLVHGGDGGDGGDGQVSRSGLAKCDSIISDCKARDGELKCHADRRCKATLRKKTPGIPRLDVVISDRAPSILLSKTALKPGGTSFSSKLQKNFRPARDLSTWTSAHDVTSQVRARMRNYLLQPALVEVARAEGHGVCWSRCPTETVGRRTETLRNVAHGENQDVRLSTNVEKDEENVSYLKLKEGIKKVPWCKLRVQMKTNL
ncbi:hypothetical protein EGW08_011181 [Elysia chlorotica]|uniref:Uncharacterized protein n=1 Tax=Elysia chlorotica TaxID=188477 RepID=A0A3S1BDJ2_ELYCH|nr:hypothetical protein EGW08_011181 [Elysia chlorotica]